MAGRRPDAQAAPTPLPTEVEELTAELEKYPKVMAVILFGSHAKKKATPLSDVDIAVISKDPDKKTEGEIASFSSNVFDVSNFHRLPLYIQFEVLKYGRTLFVRDEAHFKEVKRAVLGEYLEMSRLYERMSERALASPSKDFSQKKPCSPRHIRRPAGPRPVLSVLWCS